jgi:predicted DNA-binding transcriptional regulator AlpA
MTTTSGAPKDGARLLGTHVAAKTKHHHLDRRAGQIVDADIGADDELLSTAAVAKWLSVSTQWLEIGRCKNYGPEFKRIGPRFVRYQRSDVLKWLKARTYASTAEYSRRRTAA